MSQKRVLVSLCVVLVLAIVPLSSASAQLRWLGNNMTSTTTTGLTTAGIAGGVILTIMLASGGKKEASLENYMRHNAVAIQHDLYMGGGDTAQDLAEFFDVQEEDFDAFARILYMRRDVLADLASPDEVDSVSVYQFVEVVVQGMMENPRLAMHLQRLG